MSRKIAVITGTRAEYGLLSPMLRELQARGAVLQLIVTGAHLSVDHGMTVRQIEEDGFPIAVRVDMQLTRDDALHLAEGMARGLSGMAQALQALAPDIVVILGDRYEMLAAATAAFMLHLPIAHIHGGEVTEGAMDESIRHAITKLSYWHFAAAAPYAARLRQLGEDPARIFTVGAPGVDALVRTPLLSRGELAGELGLPLEDPVALFTFHPETLSALSASAQVEAVMAALEQIPDVTWLMTGANADAGGRIINAALERFAAARPRALFRLSFGSRLYINAMRACTILVGNSSSALLEAAALGRIAVNIGDRQAGRLRAPTVMDCPCETGAILACLRRALTPALQAAARPSALFGIPGAVAPEIARRLLSLALPETLRKAFHDLPCENKPAISAS